MKSITSIILFILYYNSLLAQDSSKVNYDKVIGYCLDANVKDALPILQTGDQLLTAKSKKFKLNFLQRFGGEDDQSDYLLLKQSPINDLLKIYRDYWRISLLNPLNNYDTLIVSRLFDFFSDKNIKKDNISFQTKEDSIAKALPRYVCEQGLQTTGYANTGKLRDLLVWKNQLDTTYHFMIRNEQIDSRVIMMDNFITLGWQEYATLGLNYPGGWATSEALYCVKTAYDINSESFLVGYLAHEGRHFSDYKIFPKLSPADLEYRGKLTELSIANVTLHNAISFFINNSNLKSDNPHAIANYYVIQNLSRRLFKSEFEGNIEKWKTISVAEINKVAYRLFKQNSRKLKRKGRKSIFSLI